MQNLDILIKDDNNDKLNFKPFAKKVAKGILNYKQSETLILSIEGKWGSGKTSLINLIENELKKENKPYSSFNKIKNFFGMDNDKIKIMYFKPWLLTDIEQVIKLFFNELKILLKNETKITKSLNRFEDMLIIDNIRFKSPIVDISYNFNDLKSLKYNKQEINTLLQDINKKIVT